MSTASPAAPPRSLIEHHAALSQADVGLWWRQSLEWLGDHWLQIAIASAIGAAIVLVLLGIRTVGLRLCRSDREGRRWPSVVGATIAATRLWFMVPLAAHLVGGYADPPAVVHDIIRFLFVVAAALQAAFWMRALILGFVERRAGADADHQSNIGSAIGIIRLLVSFALFAIATILILDNLGVNVTGLIAGLGIGGIAIGLAAQGIFSDLFAALAIIFDRPFRRGDSVQWDKTSGTVEAIGLKSTRLRASTGEQIVISNAQLLNKELHNMARQTRRRSVVKFGIVYQTPVEACAAIPDMVRKIVEAEPKCTVARVGLIGFGASSLDYELQFDVHSESGDEAFEAHNAVCLAILKAFNAAGITFSYPAQAPAPAAASA